jgi:ABC-2 type transport system ATP-binding protein
MKILETTRLRKEYGALLAVNDVDLTVEKGHVLGLIGPNGAGKTTLLRILASILNPTAGTAQVMGLDLRRDYLKIRTKLGFMPDFFNLYNDLTLRECVSFFAAAYSVPSHKIPQKVTSALEFVELLSKQDDLVQNLSRGMVQRLGIAALLVHSPEVFLLDEPASGLDPKARIQLREILKRLSSEGKTIIISSHILTELSGFCSHIALMDRGRMMMHGSVEEIEQKVIGARRVIIEVVDSAHKAAELIGNNKAVKNVSEGKNNVIADIEGDEKTLAGILKTLVSNNIDVFGFHQEKTNLEDLFMKISSSTEAQP